MGDNLLAKLDREDVAMILDPREEPVLFIYGYFDVNDGLEGRSANLMGDWARLIQLLGHRYVIIAGFNSEPSDISKTAGNR